MSSTNNYYFEQLNRDAQRAYLAIKKGLQEIEASFRVPKLSAKELSDVFFTVRLDNPQIFYATSFSYRYYPDSTEIEFIPVYMFTPDKIREHRAGLEARVRKIVREAAELDDVGKEEFVHDFICRNVRYDKLKKPYSHEIIGPLTNGVGVCEGIAKSVKLLLDELGIWCIIALSENNPEKGIKYRHTWNIVRLSGKYYNLDVTFDNTLSSESHIRYDYFNVYDKAMERDHEPVIFRVPECTDNDAFYYKRKKLSWTTYDEVRNRAGQAAKKGRDLIFHWRGGYLTREVLAQIRDIVVEEAEKRDKQAVISLNWAQAVIWLSFLDGLGEADIVLEEANEGEKDTVTECTSNLNSG